MTGSTEKTCHTFLFRCACVWTIWWNSGGTKLYYFSRLSLFFWKMHVRSFSLSFFLSALLHSRHVYFVFCNGHIRLHRWLRESFNMIIMEYFYGGQMDGMENIFGAGSHCESFANMVEVYVCMNLDQKSMKGILQRSLQFWQSSMQKHATYTWSFIVKNRHMVLIRIYHINEELSYFIFTK